MTQNLAHLAEAEERRETVRTAAAEFLRSEWSLTELRRCVENAGLRDAPELWAGMQRLGWHQIVPFRDDAEMELGAAEFCAIVEETGYAMAPTPLVPCVVARVILDGVGGDSDADLPALAHAEAERSTDPLRTTVTAVAQATGFRLVGAKRFVPYAAQADLIIVNARQDDGTVGLFAVDSNAPGVERTSLTLLDASPCAEVRFVGAEIPADARIADGDRALDLLGEALAVETLARCAELVGVGARALELAVEYARQRTAFGRPIGSFQAVQHKLVNLLGDLEVARALYQGAARSKPSHKQERDVAVAMATFAALDALHKVPEGALQVFGGIGTTWEHDIHFFVRRAATLHGLLDARTQAREVVARHLAS